MGGTFLQYRAGSDLSAAESQMSGNTSLNSYQFHAFFYESQAIALNIFEEYI